MTSSGDYRRGILSTHGQITNLNIYIRNFYQGIANNNNRFHSVGQAILFSLDNQNRKQCQGVVGLAVIILMNKSNSRWLTTWIFQYTEQSHQPTILMIVICHLGSVQQAYAQQLYVKRLLGQQCLQLSHWRTLGIKQGASWLRIDPPIAIILSTFTQLEADLY